jgi:hypothetical protein
MNYSKIIYIGNQKFYVAVATTDDEIQKGLMLKNSLPKDSGMLFIYDDIGHHGIWMKNTYIPLDVIWFDENKKVVYKKTLQPNNIEVHYPAHKSKYILEVLAGTFDGEIGDIIKFKGENE